MKAFTLFIGAVFFLGCLLFGYSAYLTSATPEHATISKLFAFTSVTQFVVACIMVWTACKQKKTG